MYLGWGRSGRRGTTLPCQTLGSSIGSQGCPVLYLKRRDSCERACLTFSRSFEGPPSTQQSHQVSDADLVYSLGNATDVGLCSQTEAFCPRKGRSLHARCEALATVSYTKRLFPNSCRSSEHLRGRRRSLARESSITSLARETNNQGGMTNNKLLDNKKNRSEGRRQKHTSERAVHQVGEHTMCRKARNSLDVQKSLQKPTRRATRSTGRESR